MTRSSGNLRVAVAADAHAIQAIYAPFVSGSAISFETEVPSAERMAERIAATLESFPWLVWEEDGRVAGYAYATRHRDRLAYQWSVDVSAYVDPGFHRRGIAGTLYRELLAILERQGFVNAYAGIALPNAASVALHESVGFIPLCVYRNVGFKLGCWRDVGWWHRAIAQPARDPPAPTPFSKYRV